MLCRKYGVPPIEPVLDSSSKTIDVSIPVISGSVIDTNFLMLKASTYNNTLKYIDQPIKGPISMSEASVISFSLDQVSDINSLKKQIRSIRKPIEISGVLPNISDYKSYKTSILDIISDLPNHITLNCSTYLADVIQDIQSYQSKIHALGTSIYGTCSSQNPSLQTLLYYNVNRSTLLQQIQFLKQHNIDLVLDIDAICQPTDKITNTFGSQLWLFDLLCQLSSIGIKNVFVNMDSFSNVYGILAYLYFSRNNSIINPMKTSLNSNINMYVSENVKEYLLAVVHKDDSQSSLSVNINGSGSLIRLVSNQMIEGICGMAFGELTFDGSSDGNPIQIRTHDSNTQFSTTNVSSNFLVGRMSVAILRISKTQSGGAYFENINNSDEKRTVVTIRPNPLVDYYDSVPTTMSLTDFKEMYREDL